MRTRTTIKMAVAAIALIAMPTFAQDVGGSGRRACNPEGTWFGSEDGESYILTVAAAGGGRYQVVSRHLANPPGCVMATEWRGEMVRTGLNTYRTRIISLCDSAGTLLLVAGEGTWELTDCEHATGTTNNVGIYFWGTDFTPFVDPFDVPVIPPGPPVVGFDVRMPPP